MLHPFLLFLLLGAIEPAYPTLASLVPEPVVLDASSPSLAPIRAPVKKGESLEPVVSAESIYSLDLQTSTPLLTRDIFSRRKIASISKLVNAMIILDGHKLDETVKISRNAASQEPSKIGLRPGEEITVGNLLTGLLVSSGNDAAVALAEFDAGSETTFAKKMNARATELGLMNTHFSNAKGFDEPANYSTAFDTVIFARAALDYPFIRKTVATKTTSISSVNGKINHQLKSTNELLENPHFRIIGLKTGLTPAAGPSFVSLAIGPNGHEILTVVLDSPDRFRETQIVLDWIFRNYNFP